MTNSKDLNNIAGSADGAVTQEELRANATFVDPNSPDYRSLGERMVSTVDQHISTFTDVDTSTKYPSDPNVAHIGAGAFSFNPLLGRFLFGNSSNEPTKSAFKIDQYKDFIRSEPVQTIVGSTDIQTKGGYFLNPVGKTYPSTHFTPQKTWVRNLFAPLLDDKLMEIAFLEALQVVILLALKGTKSEQIVKENKIDLGTIILGSQEIEDHILSQARS